MRRPLLWRRRECVRCECAALNLAAALHMWCAGRHQVVSLRVKHGALGLHEAGTCLYLPGGHAGGEGRPWELAAALSAYCAKVLLARGSAW